MIDLKSYLDKNVKVVDVDKNIWVGVAEEYIEDDEWDDYSGESLTVRLEPNRSVCFGTSDIESIEVIDS